MDFQRLLARMVELDQPTSEACGDSMGMPPGPEMAKVSEAPPPSMSVNLNAQGMNNIEQMMKLFQKVNPDMMPKVDLPMPSLSSPDIKPMSKPDMPSMASKMINMDPPEKEAADGNFSKATTEPSVSVKDVSASVPDGTDLHRSKKSYSDKPYRGDNPMAVEDIKKYLESRYKEIKES
jgi:hypothetical protein